MKEGYVYIVASRPNGAIYIGVTSNLIKRVFQHREGLVGGHTKKYQIKQLVYYETHEDMEHAILREKRLKKWTRAMKNDLIVKQNPLWDDLYSKIVI